MKNFIFVFLASDFIPIIVAISIVAAVLLVLIILVLAINFVNIKDDELGLIINKQTDSLEIKEKGRYLINPFLPKIIKKVKKTPTKVLGNIYKYKFEIEYVVENYYLYSKTKTTFTQELTKRSSKQMLSLELATDLIINTAKEMGIKILLLNYIKN